MVGSSPLTRGAPKCPLRRPSRWGLIPAYAGSTYSAYSVAVHVGAHPRLRGEHHEVLTVRYRHLGSSPLTRGALLRFFTGLPLLGLIPAYAGSTFFYSRCCFLRRAHPRLRGEHTAMFVCSMAFAGSSPLTRGAHDMDMSAEDGGRLIPAYAGSTS